MNETTVIRGIEQGRAKFAYECANQLLSLCDSSFSNYKIEVKAIIQQAFKGHFKKTLDNDKSRKKEERLLAFIDHAVQITKDYEQQKPEKQDFDGQLVDFYRSYGKEYKGNVKKLPAMIKTNGIGETFAFIKSKAKPDKAYTLIYSQFTQWLKQEPNKLIRKELWSEHNDELVKVVISLNSPEYRSVTIEMLAFLNWLKRFAEGLIEGEEESS